MQRILAYILTLFVLGFLVLGWAVFAQGFQEAPLVAVLLEPKGSIGDWDGLSEATLSNDQDQDGEDDTTVWVFDWPVNGENEPGDVGTMDVQSSALLQVGGVAGCTNTAYPNRVLDGADDYFSVQGHDAGVTKIPTGQNTFTIMLCNSGVSQPKASAAHDVIRFSSGAPINYIWLREALDNYNAYVQISHAGVADLASYIPGEVDYSQQEVIWTISADGESVMAGFSYEIPEEFSDLVSGVSDAMNEVFAAGAFSELGRFMFNAGGWPAGTLRWIVVSKLGLMRNK